MASKIDPHISMCSIRRFHISSCYLFQSSSCSTQVFFMYLLSFTHSVKAQPANSKVFPYFTVIQSAMLNLPVAAVCFRFVLKIFLLWTLSTTPVLNKTRLFVTFWMNHMQIFSFFMKQYFNWDKRSDIKRRHVAEIYWNFTHKTNIWSLSECVTTSLVIYCHHFFIIHFQHFWHEMKVVFNTSSCKYEPFLKQKRFAFAWKILVN